MYLHYCMFTLFYFWYRLANSAALEGMIGEVHMSDGVIVDNFERSHSNKKVVLWVRHIFSI